MPNFDPRSFIITSAVAGILCTLIFFILRRSLPKEIGGIAEWAWGCLAMVAGAVLFACRDILPALLSIVAANAFVIGGIMLMYISIRRFAGFRTAYARWLIALALIVMALVWLTFFPDRYRGRIELVTTINMTLFLASAAAISRLKEQGFPERFTAAIFVGTAAVSFARFITALTGYDTSDYRNDNSLVQHVYLATFSFSLISLSLGFMLMVSKKLQLRLEYSASHDDLTGAYTRTTFFELLTKEIGRAARHAQSLSLLIIDIDDFKLINDRHGHPMGDEVIRNFARLAAGELRDHDILCRYGGEEFVVLLPNAGPDEATAAAERIRARFEKFALEGVSAATVSIGVVSAHGAAADMARLIERADQALYIAKNAGKNRVVLAA